ncbi:MAG: BspA family leucine-rich repeat surface protein, partial [Methylococcales symbiont of Iophon sp. n. MRB-2018]
NDITRFNLANGADKEKLIDVQQWGTANWTTMVNAFFGASAMTMSASDSPDLAGVTSMSNMFVNASVFNQDIGNWNVAGVTNMSGMFTGADTFNQNIGSWNVAGVTTMNNMFADTSAFNQDIGNWNVASVTNMLQMFRNASAFNQDIGGWNVAGVTIMNVMFANTNAFNQDIGSWNVASVTSMSNMFFGTDTFNQNIGSWNVARVTNMVNMFANANAFNQDIGGWNVARVTTMESMFSDASAFNQDIGGWNVASVTNMESIFSGASAFNQDIGGWNVASVVRMSSMFANASAFNQDIGSWNVARVTDMFSMFSGASAFNQEIGSWNVARVTDMFSMFSGASAFNQDIGGWNVASVTNMLQMFVNASAFNQDIGGWNVAGVTIMSNMFFNADAFNQNLGRWYVDETVDNDQGMLQTVNSNYDGVNDLTVLNFNFVAQNAVLTAQNPTYTLAADAADNARFTLDSNALNINSDSVVDGSYTVRIAVGNADFGSSNSIELIIVVDASASPTVTSIVRTSPTDETTSADTLIWTLTFSENVQNVDTADFTLSGTTATLTVDGTSSNAEYLLTVTGGDLAELNGTVTLAFADDQNIEDLADNALIVTTPTGDNEPSYILDNTDASLSDLTLSAGTLAPDFDSGTLEYNVSVANSIETLSVTPTVSDSNASFVISATATDGSDLAVDTSGQFSGLTVGDNSINITVTAVDGTTVETYTIIVTRAANDVATLDSLSLSEGTLAPAFASGTFEYNVSVANSISELRVTPTVSDNNATVTVNDITVTSGESSTAIDLEPGVDTTINVVVTAQDGTTTQSYTVTVTRDAGSVATLNSLSLSTGTLAPAFASGTLEYNVSVANSINALSVTPTVSDSNATVTVNGNLVTSGVASTAINLPAGADTDINVVVTAENDSTTQSYTIIVTRGAGSDVALSSLSLSEGSLTPAFASA